MKSEQSQIVNMRGETWAFVSRSGVGGREIGAAIDSAFAELTEAIARAGVRTKGPPRAHYYYRDGGELGFDLGFAILADDEARARAGRLKTGPTLSGEALMVVHQGPYDALAGAYRALEQELEARRLKGKGDTWEVYLNDPDVTPAASLLTEIYWPIEGHAGAQCMLDANDAARASLIKGVDVKCGEERRLRARWRAALRRSRARQYRRRGETSPKARA
jgi:AraC family transcriptional regulator